MHWKLKSFVQNQIAKLPGAMANELYYAVQRSIGGLRRIDPLIKFRIAAGIWHTILDSGIDPVDKRFLEVGTGRVPALPIAYWIMGAAGCVTVDINRYLRSSLIEECLRFIVRRKADVENALGAHLNAYRLDSLIRYTNESETTMDGLLQLCGIRYLAPGDAGNMDLGNESVDFHTSTNVLEHVPPDALRCILSEAGRVLSSDGLAIHRIDYTDHFAHSDKSISRVNFLRYDDTEWSRYADNRYMYMNRLRHDDMLELFRGTGLDIVASYPRVHRDLYDTLEAGAMPIAERFRDKSIETLATTGATIVARCR